jgi:cyclopropane fatty-acyl-phospholipid synthase-like methyltransferase
LDVENLRLHYARTLRDWAANFEANLPRIRTLADEAFIRRWRLFFAASAAGFRGRQHPPLPDRVFQWLEQLSAPDPREHVYRD